MRGLVLKAPYQLEVDDVPEPQMADDRVVLEVEACTICGGDLKAYAGQGSVRTWPRQIKGHEYSGTVVAVGRDVRGFQVGDRVAYVCLPACGSCYACRTGHMNYCQAPPPGTSTANMGAGFGERVAFAVAPYGIQSHYRIPDEIDTVAAALAEPGTCAIGAVQRGKIQPGDIVAVIGLGGLGQMVAQVATGAGARTIGIDVQSEKVELAKGWCEWVIHAGEQDVREAVLEVTQGIGADVIFEVVGRPEALEQAFQLVRLGGRIVIVGVHRSTLPAFDPEWIFRKDVELVGAKGAMPLLTTDGTPLVFDLMRRGIIQTAPLISTFSLDEAPKAFEAQRTGGVPKAAILPKMAGR